MLIKQDMAREIPHVAHGPDRFDAEDLADRGGSIAICRSGLSNDKPFCDGSHAATADEDQGVVYKYEHDDAENPRRVISEIVYADE